MSALGKGLKLKEWIRSVGRKVTLVGHAVLSLKSGGEGRFFPKERVHLKSGHSLQDRQDSAAVGGGQWAAFWG